MNEQILLEITGNLHPSEEQALIAIDAGIGKANSLIGGDVIVQILLVVITPLALKIIRDIALARINKGSSITLKTKSFSLTNVDRKTLLEVLDKIESKD